MELDRHRAASLVVALVGLVALATVADSRALFGFTAALLLGFVTVWFPDALAGVTGIELGSVEGLAPEKIVRGFGWLVLGASVLGTFVAAIP